MKTAFIFPGSLGKTTEDALVRAYQGSTILSCKTSSGNQLGLLFGTGQPSAVIPSPPAPGTWYLVYFYGNGMCLETSCYEFAQFRQLGCTVLIPEYPGYGISSGWASESGCYEAADAAFHYLTETVGAHPCPDYLEHPFKHLAVSSVIDLALLGKLNSTLTGFRTDLPSSQHNLSAHTALQFLVAP